MNRIKTISLILISVFFLLACSPTKNLPEANPELTAINPSLQNGLSFESAIVVNSVKAEYEWLAENYPGYTLQMQALSQHKKKPYDVLFILTVSGAEKSIYFDISKFFGKF